MGTALVEVKDLEARYTSEIRCFKADITDTQECTELFSQIQEYMAPIDVLVLKAGSLSEPGPLAIMDINEFWKNFEINAKVNTALLQLSTIIALRMPL
jgi:short-subunit dehydrogenase